MRGQSGILSDYKNRGQAPSRHLLVAGRPFTRLTYEHLLIYSYIMAQFRRPRVESIERGREQPRAGRIDVCEGPHTAGKVTDDRREHLMPTGAVQALAQTFRILGDPTRVRILDVLAAGELCVCDIAELVGISESAVSHQLRLLRGTRLVRPRRAGRQVYYSFDDQHILSLFQQGLRHVTEEAR